MGTEGIAAVLADASDGSSSVSEGGTVEYQSIRLTNESGVTFLLLNRQESMNAVNDEMRMELQDALRKLKSDAETRVLVFSGAGKAFSAGADLRHIKSLYETFRDSGLRPSFGGPELAREFLCFPKPMIAAVNGAAVGWGMTVSLTCDIRIASPKARFSAAFVRAGLTPEFGSSYLLPRLIGHSRAAELFFTGRMVDAKEALEMGLINRVVPQEELLSEAMSLARAIAGQPYEAVIKAKELLRGGAEAALKTWIDYEALVFRERMISEEHYQAVTSLLAQMGSKESMEPRKSPS